MFELSNKQNWHICVNSDIDCAHTARCRQYLTQSDYGGDGVDLPQDLQLALNIRGSVLLSALLHVPNAPPRDRVNRKSERYFARLRVVFHPRAPLTPGVLFACVRVHARAWRTHVGRQCVCEIEHAVVSFLLRPRPFSPRDVSYRGCREARRGW